MTMEKEAKFVPLQKKIEYERDTIYSVSIAR